MRESRAGRCKQAEQVGKRTGLAVDDDGPEREIEFEAQGCARCPNRFGEEFDHAGWLWRDRPCDGAGVVIAECGEDEAATAAELGLAQVAAVKGVENLAPLSGRMATGHPEPSHRSREAVDGLGRTLTIHHEGSDDGPLR